MVSDSGAIKPGVNTAKKNPQVRCDYVFYGPVIGSVLFSFGRCRHDSSIQQSVAGVAFPTSSGYADRAMKLLHGSELAGYIKQRQAKEVRRLKQASNIFPALAIVQDHPDPVIDTYVKLKVKYGSDIGVVVDTFQVKPTELSTKIKRLNDDEKYNGLIIQLPLNDTVSTDDILNSIDPAKDVDGLGESADYNSATAQAILWLLAGYGIETSGQSIVLVGQGKLVGRPLARLFRDSGVEPITLDESSPDLNKPLKSADIIVTATGQPGIIKSGMIKPGATLIDAGTTSESGQIRGDADEKLYERTDINITPRQGGVGPLTVASLFDNLLHAARARMAAP